MQLTAEQESSVRAWAAEGASLSDIQTRLADDFGIRLSYLDTRFLLIDLKVDLAEKPEKKTVAAPLASGAAAPGGAPGAAPDPYDPTAGGYPDEAADDYPQDDYAGPGAPAPSDPASAQAPAGGGVQVELDRIQRPGFAASGSIVCSDGVKGEWGIDNYGRVAMSFPDNKGYQPAVADKQAFMQRLQALLGGY